nr:MAG TPA: hypothetical protein [Bacteriophage sp.]
MLWHYSISTTYEHFRRSHLLLEVYQYILQQLYLNKILYSIFFYI